MVVRDVGVDKQTLQERRLLIELLAERLGTTPEWVRSEGLPALLQATRDATMPLEAAVDYLRGLRQLGAANSPQPSQAEHRPQSPADEERAREQRDTRWDEDRAAFQRLQPQLQCDYPGKFVAFEDGKVVAVGDTRLEAAEEANRVTGEARSRLVRHVDEDIPPIRRVNVRLDRPRSVERIK